MLVERNLLEEKLGKTISSIYGNKKIVDNFCENMFHLHGVKLGICMDIIGRNLDLSEVSKELLLWITKELAVAVQTDNEYSYLASNLDIEKYFTNHEIQTTSNTKFKDSNEEIYPIVFEQVVMVNNDQWVTATDVDKIKELRDYQVVHYNRKTQRELSLRKTKNGFQYVITIIKRALAQIQQLMLEGKFISNAISFNINADEVTDFEYDAEEMTLTIYSGKLDIIDGNHRYISMTNVKDMKPDFEYRTIVNIMNFSEDKGKRYIVQEDKKNKIKRSRIKSLDIDNRGTVVVTYLNEQSSSNLKGLINAERGSLIDFGVLVDIINYNFPMKDNKDELNVKLFVLKAFNKIIEDNINLISDKQNDLAWVFYGRVMKEIYESTDKDMDKLVDKIHKINKLDFDNLGFKAHNIGKTLYKKVDNILNEL